MAFENITGESLEGLIGQIASLTTLFQAIGGIIIAYIVFNTINAILNRKKRNELKKMSNLLESIDKKLDKVIFNLKSDKKQRKK